MTKAIRQVAPALALIAIIGPLGAEGTEPAGAATSRVRADDPILAAAIREGIDRSATFRTLIERIDATNGLVFVRQGRCRHGVRACLRLSVTVVGPNRLLHIAVDTDKAQRDLVAVLGHELRHAIEVLEDPAVTTDAAIYMLYMRIGTSTRGSFETPAAIEAGDRVHREVKK